MSTNSANTACPVGTAVFFPWMTEPPNSDWVLCNGDEYPNGTYPLMDQVRAAQPINCRVDKPVHPTSSNTIAESDEIVLSAAYGEASYPLYSILQPDNPVEDADFWYGGHWLKIIWKKGVIGRITGIEITARNTGDAHRKFPEKVKLIGGDESEPCDLTDVVSLTDPGPAGTVYIPVTELDTPESSWLKLEIAEPYPTCIGRLRIFAKRDDIMITPKVTRRLNTQPGVWCLRVAR